MRVDADGGLFPVDGAFLSEKKLIFDSTKQGVGGTPD